MSPRNPAPISALRTKTSPSRIGMPRWSANSSGAAPVPPSLPSTTMKSGRMPVSSIALQTREKLPRVADAKLEADRLAAAQAPELGDEAHHLERGREGAVARRRKAVAADRHAADRRDFFGDFRRRQHAAVAGLGALAELDLDHLDLVVGGRGGEAGGIERAFGGAATEIARADFPDHVAAALAVIGAEAAFAGVMGEAAERRAAIEGANGVGAQRAEAHRRDVEDGRRIGLGAAGTADQDAERRLGDLSRRDRMAQPLVALRVDVELRAERPLVELHLGALVDDGALVARKRQTVGLALEEILPHLRPHLLEQEAQVGGDRIVAQNRVRGLNEVAQAEQRQRAE